MIYITKELKTPLFDIMFFHECEWVVLPVGSNTIEINEIF